MTLTNGSKNVDIAGIQKLIYNENSNIEALYKQENVLLKQEVTRLIALNNDLKSEYGERVKLLRENFELQVLKLESDLKDKELYFETEILNAVKCNNNVKKYLENNFNFESYKQEIEAKNDIIYKLKETVNNLEHSNNGLISENERLKIKLEEFRNYSELKTLGINYSSEYELEDTNIYFKYFLAILEIKRLKKLV